MKRLIVLAAVAMITACGIEDKKVEEQKAAEPLSQSINSNAFNQSFGQVMDSYYHLKDALVLSNDTLAKTSANRIIALSDSVNLEELKADSSIVLMAQGYLDNISAEAKGLVGEKDIEGKRKSFQMISDNMYDLVRTVRYDRETIYHQFCPMAFNDAGAYWLSRTSDIKNPYFGRKMLTCGEVKDSLDFRSK
jgi:Cu(I)/Ag(I) efflux system membrane fusion protein